MTKKFTLTKKEATLVRKGLKIMKDSLKVGADYQYFGFNWNAIERENKRCVAQNW